MDSKAELIRKGNWPELLQLYSGDRQFSWEAGWLSLQRLNDLGRARQNFLAALQDDRYAAAAYIVLWWMQKHPPSDPPLDLPQSLKVYEAYMSGRLETLLAYLERAPENGLYFSKLLSSAALEKVVPADLEIIRRFPRTPEVSWKLAVHFLTVLKMPEAAADFIRDFYSDSCIHKALEEVDKAVLSLGEIRQLKSSYEERDLGRARKILQAAGQRLQKQLKNATGSSQWGEAILRAIDYDLDNLSVHADLKITTALSPAALLKMGNELELWPPIQEPEAFKYWEEFLGSSRLESPPLFLQQDSHCLWQIEAELRPDALSEALLKFPDDERFLFLWSLRQNEHLENEKDPRRWPSTEKESTVVRRNLERAYEKTEDKIGWFAQIRQAGCSQEFYELSLSRLEVPLTWVVEDLKAGLIANTTTVRGYLKDRLSVVTEKSSDDLVQNSLQFLTPAEMQFVLTSRYILTDLPETILKDDYLELFWEARSRVSADVFERWEKKILSYLSKKHAEDLTPRDWTWIQSGWEKNQEYLKIFSPQTHASSLFPWEHYLEELERYGLENLLNVSLLRINNERVREGWIFTQLQKGQCDQALYSAIQSLDTENLRYRHLAEWFEIKQEYEKSFRYRIFEFDSVFILNEKKRIGEKLAEIFSHLDFIQRQDLCLSLHDVAEYLYLNSLLSIELAEKLGTVFEELNQEEKSWRWTVRAWELSPALVSRDRIQHLLTRAVALGRQDEAQRMFVHELFEGGHSPDFNREILGILLLPTSALKLRHLRREFIDRASEQFPLALEVLRARANYDYRAVLLWDCFYHEPLENSAQPPSYFHKRRYELWKTTDGSGSSEVFAPFAKIFSSDLSSGLKAPKKESPDSEHAFLSSAKRSLQRLEKSYGVRSHLKIVLVEGHHVPFQIDLKSKTFYLKNTFFDSLDEDTWSALCVGVLQIISDHRYGLFDVRRLGERFFQGMLLSGAPLAKLLRLLVWMALEEGLIEPELLQADPEGMLERLPFLKSVLNFYLSQDFEQKIADCALIPL